MKKLGKFISDVIIILLAEKMFAIVDLQVSIKDSSPFIDVSVVPHNWVGEDGTSCAYPTYLKPKKQVEAIKSCMDPTANFTRYPAVTRAWFGKKI